MRRQTWKERNITTLIELMQQKSNIGCRKAIELKSSEEYDSSAHAVSNDYCKVTDNASRISFWNCAPTPTAPGPGPVVLSVLSSSLAYIDRPNDQNKTISPVISSTTNSGEFLYVDCELSSVSCCSWVRLLDCILLLYLVPVHLPGRNLITYLYHTALLYLMLMGSDWLQNDLLAAGSTSQR